MRNETNGGGIGGAKLGTSQSIRIHFIALIRGFSQASGASIQFTGHIWVTCRSLNPNGNPSQTGWVKAQQMRVHLLWDTQHIMWRSAVHFGARYSVSLYLIDVSNKSNYNWSLWASLSQLPNISYGATDKDAVIPSTKRAKPVSTVFELY